MALNIRNKEAEELARALAELTGETKTQAVIIALKDRLDRVQRSQPNEHRIRELLRIARKIASLPVLDDRSPEELLYDEDGLPN